MDEPVLDDTYDLLSPLRRSYVYSDSFISSNEGGSPRQFSSTEPAFKSSFESSKLHTPKLASTSKYPTNVKKSPKQKRKVAKAGKPKIEYEHDTTKELMKMPSEPGNVGDLTVWEDWLVKKVQAERELQEKKRKELLEEREEEERLKREKEARQKRAEIKHQQWCEERMLKLKLQRLAEKRERMLQEELKSQKEAEIREKAKSAYQKWSEQQMQKDKELREKEREKKEKEQAELEERQRKNEESFQQWLKKVKENRAPTSCQKSDGPTGYPSPSFQNPRPWVGPMSDKYTRDAVRRQHKQMIAEKHAVIQKQRARPATASIKKGLVKTGPQKNKGVLICRPASANPLFYNVPNRNNRKFMQDTKVSTRGRS